jgi:exonuclease SbcD
VIRLLHTSDWHLGLELGGHDRLPEQKRFLAWLLETCETRRVDALLVSGDVYDVANPSVAAQAAFASFLVELRYRLPGTTVVVVAGNHDSGARLELPQPFCQALGGIDLVGAATPSDLDRHLVLLRDNQAAPAAVCLAVPFLRAGDIECRVREGESPDQAFSRSVDEFYASLRARAEEIFPGLAVVAMGHLTLLGSERAGSERILIGGLESVAPSALSRHADYTALGHIHRAQKAGSDDARYSGSPLAMDFDERRHPHQVLVVELAGSGEAPTIAPVEVPEFVPLWRLPETPGSWDDLERSVRETDWSRWAALPAEEHPLVEFQYLSTGMESDLRTRTEALCAGRPLRLVGSPRALERKRDGTASEATPARNIDSREAPQEIFERHWQRQNGAPVPEEVLACFREIVEQVRSEGGAP